jgi:Ca-activated chloride channel homolog
MFAPMRQERADFPLAQYEMANTERYSRIHDNPRIAVADDPLSTFSVDVDTASYANVRRFLNDEQLPPPDAVRIEELINYFDYGTTGRPQNEAVAIHTETAPCPWNSENSLVKIDITTKTLEPSQRLAKNLVFLVDVSGSMGDENKLPLLKKSLSMLADKLDERDRVAIVVYAGSEGLALPPTSGENRERIRSALAKLESGGSTNGAGGIRLAYDVAAQNFIEGGLNRVILATDGDFNVGMSSEGDLTRLIEKQRETGVYLSVLGFGTGNYNDSMMEKLAQHGNGNYAYIDSAAEAKRVLVDNIDQTLTIAARDVKVQVEFNPAQVGEYRLIGYENRVMRHEDFVDAKKDAGDMGAGEQVTALYEISPIKHAPAIPLKYQSARRVAAAADSIELLTVKVRFKNPNGQSADEVRNTALPYAASHEVSPDMRFVSSIAAFGLTLRDSEYKGSATFALASELAKAGTAGQTDRLEFMTLINRASALSSNKQTAHQSRF